MNTNISKWYATEFSKDTGGLECIDDNATFEDLYNKLLNKESIYDIINDSFVRERCFENLVKLTNKNYNYFYNLWLLGD